MFPVQAAPAILIKVKFFSLTLQYDFKINKLQLISEAVAWLKYLDSNDLDSSFWPSLVWKQNSYE